MTDSSFLCILPHRALLKISGEDAQSFLQNLVTNDMRLVAEGKLTYACLLTPQGRVLHDFFISKRGADFYIEAEAPRTEDLLRRLKMFKLRSKVELHNVPDMVCVSSEELRGDFSYKDPRPAPLGYRSYFPENTPTALTTSDAFRDLRIQNGIPEGSVDMPPETDTIANLNLDQLNAVAWDKGCYLGQEITAMTENRGVAKKRLVIISGEKLTAGQNLTQDGHAVGDIRAVNTTATEGLAMLKLASLENKAPITAEDGEPVAARLPEWLKLKYA